MLYELNGNKKPGTNSKTKIPQDLYEQLKLKPGTKLRTLNHLNVGLVMPKFKLLVELIWYVRNRSHTS